MIGSRLDHIAIHVRDRISAATVVRELLGHDHLQDLDVPGEDGTAHLAVYVQGGDRFRLVLCDAVGSEHPITRWIETRGPGVHHVAHHVPILEEALEKVESAGGVGVGAIVEAPELRQVFTNVTPDGLLHELTERTIRNEAFDQHNVAALIVAGADRTAVRPPSSPWNERRR